MKTFTKILVALLLSVSLLHAAAFEKTAKFRTTKVLISAQKPLTTGANRLQFKILKNGKAVENAKVSIRAFMPAMPGMPAMETRVVAQPLQNATYEATLNFAMGGTWQMHIFITPPSGKKIRVKTSINF